MFKLFFVFLVFVFPIFVLPSYGICYSDDSKCLYTDENGIISPKKQIQNGVQLDKILCKDSKHIMMTKPDSVGCVKTQSVSKLEMRGWSRAENNIAHTEKDDVLIFTDKNEYKIGENIMITMINVGNKELKTATSVAGFVIYTQNDERVRSWWSPNLAVGKFNPNDERTAIWDQTSSSLGPPMGGKYLSHEEHGGQVRTGVYVIKANHFIDNKLDHMPSSVFLITE